MSDASIAALEECRRAEKSQALYYRALGAIAEERGDAELAERFHDLHADEQHHLSRLSARVIELGAAPAPVDLKMDASATTEGWELVARGREAEEVARYERLLQAEIDATTRSLLTEILEVERQHLAELRGKWTMA